MQDYYLKSIFPNILSNTFSDFISHKDRQYLIEIMIDNIGNKTENLCLQEYSLKIGSFRNLLFCYRNFSFKCKHIFNVSFLSCMLLSCHVHVSERIHTLQSPECQGTPGCGFNFHCSHLVFLVDLHTKTLNSFTCIFQMLGLSIFKEHFSVQLQIIEIMHT